VEIRLEELEGLEPENENVLMENTTNQGLGDTIDLVSK
jgi:hypothetical protein